MKTSILVSSTAALCLLLTFTEAPKRNSAENNYTNLVNTFTYIPSNLTFTITAESVHATTAYTDPKISVKPVEDLNYIKFNASDYLESAEMATEDITENSLDYLKFKISENIELTSDEAIELPANNFANLKFDVTEYTENNELTSFDAIELPVDNFANLKFDVTEYTENTELTSFDAIELPVNEFKPQI